MNKTKIDWCDSTVNPVVGCKGNCRYCYAEMLNRRWKFVKNWHCPEYKPERLKKLKSKKPKSVFIDSMSDIGWWKQSWLNEVVQAMRDNQQHNYIALTKTNMVQLRKNILTALNTTSGGCPNLWIGSSITTQAQADIFRRVGGSCSFLSVEPILEPMCLTPILHTLVSDAIIIGAETGNSTAKVVPQKEWIEDIVIQADAAGLKVFMKESLREIMGEQFRQDKLPWEV